ncbi:MAG: hypothetical protein KAS23_08835 [Anaerohalosphaera sp.]|nr:hypothetical protein [Anaerohalosphaera sp.]
MPIREDQQQVGAQNVSGVPVPELHAPSRKGGLMLEADIPTGPVNACSRPKTVLNGLLMDGVSSDRWGLHCVYATRWKGRPAGTL